ncbi:hypothetical protein MANES_02G215130v8 [Manihot esculenta]|uniref:Uncharacterized protein n=1 Tax=Manihot esculenta TaxID=3983 RepID=A0ACB7I851_MANES|nr:hypothetical protein MANES_02G215130v8 [Manihot esculenta]
MITFVVDVIVIVFLGLTENLPGGRSGRRRRRRRGGRRRRSEKRRRRRRGGRGRKENGYFSLFN